MVTCIVCRGKLSSQVDAIPAYPILRSSFFVDRQLLPRIEEELMKLRPVSVSHLDGLRLDMGDGWLLARPSGTEPKIRLTVEARNQRRAEELLSLGKAVIHRCQDKSSSGVTGL